MSLVNKVRARVATMFSPFELAVERNFRHQIQRKSRFSGDWSGYFVRLS
jgi:hypothetical protein